MGSGYTRRRNPRHTSLLVTCWPRELPTATTSRKSGIFVHSPAPRNIIRFVRFFLFFFFLIFP